MPTWKRSPDTLIAAFHASLPDDPAVERRSMFGFPCAFVHGNMFAGLHEHRMVVRLPPDARAELLTAPGAEPFVPLGRTMREYVVLPPDATPPERAAWVARALAFASGLPEKPSKQGRRG